ncbi:MAG: hypothetical protein M3Y79_14375 [Pseudomonadota bacterium]|nr:hypothetical protein [Pseudomonadota bacterium]
MEAHTVEAELEATRTRIRALLVPEQGMGRREAFPRSLVMRVLFNPLARKAALTAVSVGAMFASQRAVKATGLWPMVSRTMGNLIGRIRH